MGGGGDVSEALYWCNCMMNNISELHLHISYEPYCTVVTQLYPPELECPPKLTHPPNQG